MREAVKREVAREISRQANEYGKAQFDNSLPKETRKQCNKSINHLKDYLAINVFGLKLKHFGR